MPHRNALAPTRLQADERRHQAVLLRLQGFTFRKIAEVLIAAGLASPRYNERGAWRDVVTAYERQRAERAEVIEQARALELDRLDALHGRIWPLALGGDLAPVDRLLAVMTLRCRILGLFQTPSARLAVADAESAGGDRMMVVQLEWGDGTDQWPTYTDVDAADGTTRPALVSGEPAA